MSETTTDRAVVVGVDGSPSAALAVAWAADIAHRQERTLRLVAAYPDRPGASDAAAVELLRAAAEQARSLFPELVVETADVAGSPRTVLLRESAAAAALVVGSRRLGPVHRIFTTSVGRALALSASCPVVVVRESPSRSITDTRVVVAVAGPESTKELELAFAEAARFGAGLTAVHVQHTRSGDRQSPDARAMLQAVLEPAVAAYPDIDVRRYVVGGSVADRLVVLSENARLLVLGGGKPGSGAVLGPISRDVLRRSHCPVAMVNTSPLTAGQASGHLDHVPSTAERKVLT